MRKDDYKTEKANLEYWFDKEYMKQDQKFRRLIALNKMCDDGTDPSEALMELYQEAETKRLRIQELEQKLS